LKVKEDAEYNEWLRQKAIKEEEEEEKQNVKRYLERKLFLYKMLRMFVECKKKLELLHLLNSK